MRKISPLVLILILALAVRVVGVYPGHNPYHPDEGKAGYISARQMYLNGNLEPFDFNYPALIPLTEYVMFRSVAYPIIFAGDYLADSESFVLNAKRPDSKYFKDIIERYSDTNLLYWGRYFTTAIGVMNVFLVYWIGRRMYSRKAGLFAAVVMTVNFRSVMNSQFDLPDTYNAFYLLFAFAVLLELVRRRTSFWYFASGIAMGASFSAKLQFFSFVPFGVWHLVESVGGNKQGVVKRLFAKKVIITGFSVLLAVVVLNFYELLEYDLVYSMMAYQAAKYGFGVMKFSMYGLSYLVKVALTAWVSLAAVAGIVIGLKRNRVGTILVTSVILSFLLYFLYLTSGAYYARNFITIIPFFCIVAGVGMWWIYERLGAILGGVVLLLVISESVYNTSVHDFYYTKPWSLTEARKWLGENARDGVTVAAHPWDKYILFSLPSTDVEKHLRFVELAPGSVYSAAEIREAGANYALIGVDVLSDATSVWWLTGKERATWNRPVGISKNTFAGLAAKELMQNTVYASVKPWQATDNNYVYVKVQDKIEYNPEDYEVLEISIDPNDWIQIEGCLKNQESNLVYSDGRFSFRPKHALCPVVRWVSPILEVENGYFYGARVKVNSLGVVPKSGRDGFIRLDFYSNKPSVWNEGSLGDWVYLSPRYYGESEAGEMEVFSEAPEGAKFVTVSYQVANPNEGGFGFSELKIYKSKAKLLRERDQETFIYELPDGLMVPYSAGGN